jgi:subtilisin family serine protease
MSLIIGKVYGTHVVGTTASVMLTTPAGELIERRFSHDAADAYGADNPERVSNYHAYELTDAGRIWRIDRDATAAYHYLTGRANLYTLTTGSTVRFLVGGASGHVSDVSDVSWAVAALTPYRFNRTRGGVIVPGVGVDPGTHAASTLSCVMGETITAHKVY